MEDVQILDDRLVLVQIFALAYLSLNSGQKYN